MFSCTTSVEVEFEHFLWKIIVFCLFCFEKIIVKNEPRAWSHSKPSFQVFQNTVREAGRSRSLLLGFPSPSAAELRSKWPCTWSAYTAPHPQVSKADSGPVLERQAAGRLSYLSALLPSEAPLRQPPDVALQVSLDVSPVTFCCICLSVRNRLKIMNL